ncbi:MAG TPA: OadG family protein [Vicinamibacterales bacterium]|nr:OadG family protein [Vicinamibacterales bacterium]
MSQEEALIVTALGMTVVFIGLVLCIAFIQLFNRIAKKVTWGEGHGGHEVAPPPPPAAAVELPPPGEPLEPDVLAVISAVLEVERTLYLGRPGSRLTIRRSLPQP